jgi:hypothetical protein
MKTQRWLAVTILATAGCGATFEQLQARAAIDLECQPQAISANALDDQTRIASGCGKQAVYVETCAGNNRANCTWMLNSPIKPAADIAAPQPPPERPSLPPRVTPPQ